MSCGRDPLPQELEQRRADELRLRALATRLQQPDRPVRRALRHPALEQPALEMVQGRSRGRRVVLGAVAQLDDLAVGLGQRQQRLHGGGPCLERDPAGLIGQRERDRHLRHAHERLDGVELRGREIVEAVEEHRPRPPRLRIGAQRVDRRPGMPLHIGAPEPLQACPVGAIERRQLLRVGLPALAGVARPPAQRRMEALRRDERALELAEQSARGGSEPGRPRRGGKQLQARVGDRGAHDPLARDRPERALQTARAGGDLVEQAPEGDHLTAEHRPRGRELALVGLDGVRGRHDEQWLGTRGAVTCGAPELRPERLQDPAGLGCVGGSYDEGQRH